MMQSGCNKVNDEYPLMFSAGIKIRCTAGIGEENAGWLLVCVSGEFAYDVVNQILFKAPGSGKLK